MKYSRLLLLGTMTAGLLSSHVLAEDPPPQWFYECINNTSSIHNTTFSVKKKLELKTINHNVSTIEGTSAEQSTLSGGTLDSNVINTGNVVTTLTGEVPKGITLENGILYVSSHVSVGTYNVSVQTCEKENSTNCVLSTVEVIVQPVPVFTGTATATGSQVFFSRTCPEGREPKAETYNANETVEATGSTQAEADTLAQDLAKKAVDKDIEDNGQLFADTYGKCVKKTAPTPPIVELPHTGPSITLGTGKQEVHTNDTIDFSFETQSGSMYTAFLCNASEEEMKNTHHIDTDAQGLSGVQQFSKLTDVCEQIYAEIVTGENITLTLSATNLTNQKILSEPGEKSFYVIKGASKEERKECVDTDGDGVANLIDIDDDNDGITDTAEGNGKVDTDKDGIPDSLDTDSDNDGVPDTIEGNDANHDGKRDTEPNGKDSNHNGLDDAFDPEIEGGKAVDMQDTDGDGTPDFQDAHKNTSKLTNEEFEKISEILYDRLHLDDFMPLRMSKENINILMKSNIISFNDEKGTSIPFWGNSNKPIIKNAGNCTENNNDYYLKCGFLFSMSELNNKGYEILKSVTIEHNGKRKTISLTYYL